MHCQERIVHVQQEDNNVHCVIYIGWARYNYCMKWPEIGA